MNALVTGGTRGIGLAMVRALRAAGHKVAVVGRGESFDECDYYLQANLDYKQHGIIESVVQNLGGLDILVNNAGLQTHSPFVECNADDFIEHLTVMLYAPFILSQEAVRHMKGGGHIVNILSVAAFQGARYVAPYVAAKHGLLGLTRAMAIELAPDIHVNAIAPGLTDTDMTKNIEPERRKLLESITPAGRFCEPEEIADALMYLINSTAVYGQVITVDNGWMVKNG